MHITNYSSLTTTWHHAVPTPCSFLGKERSVDNLNPLLCTTAFIFQAEYRGHGRSIIIKTAFCVECATMKM